MADDAVVETEQATQPETAPEPSGEAPAGRTFTQAEVEGLIRERLARASEKAAKQAEQAKSEAERKAAEEQGEFKRLYEQAKAEAEQAKAEAERIRLETLRERIGREAGLPDALTKRLIGADETELRADAEALAASLPKPATSGTDAGRGTSGGKQPPQLYQRYGGKEELAARLGINPQYLPD